MALELHLMAVVVKRQTVDARDDEPYIHPVAQTTSNVANNLRRLREAAGRRQEDVAVAARQLGLDWGRSTVGMLEADHYELKAAELLLLPLVLLRAGIGDVTLAALLVGDEENVQVGTVGLFKGEVPKLLGRKASAVTWGTTEVFEVVEAGGHPYAVPRVFGEAEQKAGRRLGVPARVVMGAALNLWGRSLAEERDARVAESAPAEAGARSLQALRAHATRALLAELEPLVEKFREEND